MNWKKWSATALGLIAGSGAAWASGFHTAEFYASQIGQGLAATTLVENAGVVATNSAGMVRLDEGFHVMGGATRFDPETSYTELDSSGAALSSGSSSTDAIINYHAYGVWNAGDYAFGYGLFFPFAAVAEYPADWPGRDLLIKQELIVGYSSFTGAYSLGENFSMGAALNIIGARAELTRSLTVLPGQEIPVTLGGTADEIGFSLSLLYEQDNWAIGFTHAPEYDLRIDGSVAFDTSAAPAFTSTFADGPASVDIGLPSVTELGFAWKESRRNPLYRAEFTVIHTGWSNFKEIKFTFHNGRPQPTEVLERNWKDTTSFKMGGSWVMSREGETDHSLRGGIFFDESPIPPSTLEPAVPDGEGRTDYSIGYGYKSGALIVDVAYFYVDIKDSQTSLDGTNPFPARYGGEVQILSSSVAFAF